MIASYIIHKDSLNSEYKKVFDKIELYSTVHILNAVSKWQVDAVLGQIVNEMLEAQENGMAVKEIVGEDLETYCRQVFKDIVVESKTETFFNAIKRGMWCILILTGLSMLLSVGDENLLELKDDNLVAYVVVFGISYFFGQLAVSLIKKQLFRSKRMTTGVATALFTAQIVIAILVAVNLGNRFSITFPAWGICLICIVYLAVYYSYRYATGRQQIEKKLKKAYKKNEISFTEQLREELPSELVKQFHKKNEKRVRKGKPALTEEEYMNKFKKEAAAWRQIVSDIVFGIIFFVYLAEMFEEPIRSLVDGVKADIFVDLAFSIVFSAVYFYIIRAIRRISSSRAILARQCIEEGKTIFQMAQEQKEKEETIAYE